jgi:hypothetical protein
MTLDVSKIPGPRIGDKPGSLLSTISIIPMEMSKTIARAMIPQQPFLGVALPFQTLPKLHMLPPIEWPPEFLAACEAIAAYAEGDQRPLLALVAERIGQKPDSLLRVRLKNKELALGKDLPIPRLFALLIYHRERLKQRNEPMHVQEQSKKIRSSIKRFESVDLALDALALKGQTHDEVLEEMIPGVAYTEKAELPPGGNLPGRVANAIRKEGRGLLPPSEPQKSEKFGIVGELKRPETKRPIPPDVPEIAEFVTYESLKRDAIKAGLSVQELGSFVFGERLGDKKAAEVLGRPAKQVAQEKLHAKRKLRRAV